jgi:Tfp pilus assembly protein PilV
MKTPASARRKALGVSLIEALVALAVMAFGMLGVVGMQASLRNSADQSKQRSEALRLAQEEIEHLRAFDLLSGAAGHDYADIATATSLGVTSNVTLGYDANTTYNRVVTLQAAPTLPSVTPAPEPLRMKTVSVAVSWKDRTSTGTADDRSVVLNTTIAELSPELGAGMGAPVNTSPPRRPGGRHISIPPGAVLQSGGTSNFTPPGLPGVTWVFSNDTGLIGRICSPLGVCVNKPYALLSGFVRFATGGIPLTGESENPLDTAFAVNVEVQYTRPSPAATVTCAVSTPLPTDTFVEYYCAVPVQDPLSLDLYWTGESKLIFPSLATATTDVLPTLHRVCRYTPNPSTDTPAAGNRAHPKVYTRVEESLVNQNFLVIEAGDGTSAFNCPIDDTSTALIDGDTRLHQP